MMRSLVQCNRFDVGLSFSTKDNDYVESLNASLNALGIRSYFFPDHPSVLAGESLPKRLPEIYRDSCTLFVPIVSRHYLNSEWTAAERRAAAEKALSEDGFMQPVRLDDTDVPEIPPEICYLDARKLRPEAIAEVIAKRLLSRRLHCYIDDRLRVSDFSEFAPIPLSGSIEANGSPIGQVHLAITCQLALEQLNAASYRMEWERSRPQYEIPIPDEAQRIVEDAGYDGPSYSLQISVLDSELTIVAHAEMRPPLHITNLNLPEPVTSHLVGLRKNADSPTHERGMRNQFFGWNDQLISGKFPGNQGRPRNNVGYFYPESATGSGSGPACCVAFIFGEIHLK